MSILSPQFDRNISPEFVWLSAMESNLLHGTLPSELAKMSALTTLYLHSNAISGTIPLGWSKLRSLEWLWLYNNTLTGPVPTLSPTMLSCALQKGEPSETNCFSECPSKCCHDRAQCHGFLSVLDRQSSGLTLHEAMIVTIFALSALLFVGAHAFWLSTRRGARWVRSVGLLSDFISESGE